MPFFGPLNKYNIVIEKNEFGINPNENVGFKIEKNLKSIKDHKNPLGDIEIKITGLRPGEKLYEELLIGDDPEKTNHSKIQKKVMIMYWVQLLKIRAKL